MRKIIHVDMDCFFAAVEMRDNPALANIPIAIAGKGPRSVTATCNYLARDYGVRSAMPVGRALQLCPHLELVPGRMSAYKEASTHIREIFSRYTDKIEPLSLDEAYLDVTDCTECNGSATLIAEKIRAEIYQELNLTASAGVAPNKFIAKIASDENKPNGQCVVPPEKIIEFVETLDLKKIPGVGPKTLEKLNAYGLFTCADVRASDASAMEKIMGKFGPVIFKRAFGIDNRDVETSRIRKSLAIETTLNEDIQQVHGCMNVVEELLPKFLTRLEKVENLDIIKQGIKVKFADFTQTTVEQSQSSLDINLFKPLLEEAIARGNGKKVRLIGLTVGFAPEQAKNIYTPQLSLPL
ncbi:DNA polymerase IV [Thalassotalea psychrophila]|uniref:DNA polymerase IV n=1 Tax=Thalassotalea psychrophila TaxID=3065647 RepID=A0ABY9TXV2_9GAMM|nr:DNA polymerase IV [Colwelliaceae bacterium SQ149]